MGSIPMNVNIYQTLSCSLTVSRSGYSPEPVTVKCPVKVKMIGVEELGV